MSHARLTQTGCADRISGLWQQLPGKVEAVVLSHAPHIYYFSGFYPLPGTLTTGSTNFLVLQRDGPRLLVTDNWQAAATREAYVDRCEIVDWYVFRTSPGQREEGTLQALLDLLLGLRGDVGVEPLHLSSSVGPALTSALGAARVVDVSPHVRALRRIKGSDEIELLRGAVEVGEVGHNAAQNSAIQAATELHVWGVVHSASVVQAGEPILMMGDFASGVERSAQGGGPPTLRVLQNGDLFIIDFFPLVRGYKCDLCNTLVVGEKPSSQQIAYFDVVRRALQAGEKQLMPGTRASSVYQAVWQTFSDEGLSARFSHHAGHGLGLEHLEAPFLVPESEDVLEAGNVVTLEPGIYSKGFGGIRLEHEYLITEHGPERLSNHFS